MFRSVLIAASLACLSAGAALADTAPTAESVAADPANWRKVDPENLILFQTTAGDVVIEIFPEAAPAHAVQFRAIIESGDFDGTAFHRVIDDFMAQGKAANPACPTFPVSSPSGAIRPKCRSTRSARRTPRARAISRASP